MAFERKAKEHRQSTEELLTGLKIRQQEKADERSKLCAKLQIEASAKKLNLHFDKLDQKQLKAISINEAAIAKALLQVIMKEERQVMNIVKKCLADGPIKLSLEECQIIYRANLSDLCPELVSKLEEDPRLDELSKKMLSG